MGQQQLLLLVLGIVIVGLAVVVGIQAFGENQKKANADALVNDAIRIASDAQAWKLKPQAFGGGANGDDNDFATFSLEQVGYEVDASGNYVNLNGTFTVTGTADLLTIQAINAANANEVLVEVDGTDSDNIQTTVTNYAP
jgi:hypothetical protein